MDKKILFQLLDDIGTHNMPNNIDLLPTIQDRLKKDRTRNKITFMPTRLIVSLMMGLLLVVTTVYAAQLLTRDPGLRENMLTPLTLSQTKGDVTVTLNWAYADANRIKIGYTFSSPTKKIVRSWVAALQLTDRQEQPYKSQFMDIQETSPNNFTADASFDARQIKDQPEHLDLRLRVSGGFKFDFTVPFNPGIRINKQPDVEAAGLNTNVEWALITPSMTRVNVCYETPDTKLWYPTLSLAYDNQSVAQEPEASYPTYSAAQNGPDDRWCQEMNFLTTYDNLPHDLTFTITRLQTPAHYSEENLRRAVKVLAKYGIEADVVPTSSDSNDSYTLTFPDGIVDRPDQEQIWIEAEAAMGDIAGLKRIEGPWTMTVHLP